MTDPVEIHRIPYGTVAESDLLKTHMAWCDCGSPLALFVYDARQWHCARHLVSGPGGVAHSKPIDTRDAVFWITRRY